MNRNDWLEKRFRSLAIPNVTVGLIALQVLIYFLGISRPELIENCQLIPQLVIEKGQVWRLLSFLFQPPPMSLFFAFFYWYLFYFMGSALESEWGTVRYNLFLGIGYLATVAAAFLTPTLPATNIFLYMSVYLAFAWLNPDFTLLFAFILPIKMKWLALIQWLTYGMTFLVGTWQARVAVVAAVLNFLVFLGPDIVARLRGRQRKMAAKSKRIKQANTARHTCAICGITNLSNPKMDFRYCSKCSGNQCYCESHLREHTHVAADSTSEQAPASQ